MKVLEEKTAEPGASSAVFGATGRGHPAIHAVLALIVLGLFAFNVQRFFFLGDDGYICFRYAQNLVEGHGPVFNPGERVEGYTQPLWVFLIAGGMALGVAPEFLAPALGIGAGLLILGTLLLVSLRWGARTGYWMWAAPLCLAANRTFCAWTTGGLGTQLFALLVLVATVRFVRERELRAHRPWGSALLFALATLGRPEGALFCAVAGLFLAQEVLLRRRRPFTALLWWGVPFTAVVGGHVLWRLGYYGDLLPNTFHAKVSGLWWEQSRLYLGRFLQEHKLVWFTPFLLLLLRPRSAALVPLLVAQSTAYVGYLAYIGGDHFEFRFLTPVLPALYWLLAELLRETGGLVGSQLRRAHLGTALGATLIMALLVTAGYPGTHRFRNLHSIMSVEKLSRYARQRSGEGRALRELARTGYLTGDELIAVRGAGALPYYSGFPILDLHGLTDRTIARTPITERGVVGHEKYATREYVRERGAILCDVANRIVFTEFPDDRYRARVSLPYFEGPVRCIRGGGYYLMFGTTLSDEDFARTFRRFEIIR